MSVCSSGVESTNEDASLCKRSAVQFGYYADPYLPHMVKFCERKTPEIHLGYFTRVRGIWHLLRETVRQFRGARFQIVNLGAGFDTLFWRLKDDDEIASSLYKFVDVDLSGITARKVMAIKRTPNLLEKVVTVESDAAVKVTRTDLHGSQYHLVAADVTNLPALEQKLCESGIDYGLPTVFICECVLVYLSPTGAADLLRWVGRRFPDAPTVLINHEQLNMADRFGEVMLSNLRTRGVDLAGVAACLSEETQTARFTASGWHGAACWDMNHVFALLPANERHRVERIEFFDEKELLTQLFQHYCLAVAWRNSASVNFDEKEFWPQR